MTTRHRISRRLPTFETPTSYGLTCFFEVQRTGNLTVLFSDFDAVVEPLLRDQYDHGMLIHRRDSLYETLLDHMERTGESLRLKVLDFPTTVENLCFQLFSEITARGLRLNRLKVRETDTSVVEYTRQDWLDDVERFASSQEIDQHEVLADLDLLACAVG